MNIVVVDFDQDFEARFAPEASVQGVNCTYVTPRDELTQSTEEAADVFFVALQRGVNRFHRLRELKQRRVTVVIAVAAQPDHVDSVVALELGADDYLPRDCEPREFLACARAVRRLCDSRSSGASPRQMELDGLALDLGSREAYIEREKIELTASEFEILRILMNAAGRTVPREDLGRRLTRRDDGRLDRALDVHVSHLRRKLGRRRNSIKTVRGNGYQFLSAPQSNESEQRLSQKT